MCHGLLLLGEGTISCSWSLFRWSSGHGQQSVVRPSGVVEQAFRALQRKGVQLNEIVAFLNLIM
jgi:hypothetical protein